jgi:endoglucanase
MRFSVVNGAIFAANTTLFLIKGVNWFGLEDCSYSVQGMWAHPMTWYLDFLRENNFNVIRVPFSQQWVLDGFDTIKPIDGVLGNDPSLKGKTTLEQLDILFDETESRGQFLVLDMHRLPCDAQSHELWYSLHGGKYTTDTFFKAWQMMIDRYGNRTNLLGIDLLNEPRGLAEWSDNPRFSWNLFVSEAFTRLNYTGLVFVEGVDWGHSFEQMKTNRINAPEERIVYSPHVYGPSVVGGELHDVTSYHSQWEREWGYLVTENKAVVIGEFGGRYIGADKTWQDQFVDYLLSVRVPGIFWSLNPSSSDTGGLLQDDWTTPMTDKLALLDRLQPHPTFF